MNKRVLVPVAPGFEELECVAAVDILRRAGCQVITASVGATNPIVGRNRIRLMTDLDLSEALAEWGQQWDLVLLVGGGQGTTNLENDATLVDLVRRRLAAGGLTAAICAAPRVLAKAGLDPATAITGHPACRQDLAGYDAYQDKPVVVSGHVITSRGAGTAVEFGLACVEALLGHETAERIRADIVA